MTILYKFVIIELTKLINIIFYNQFGVNMSKTSLLCLSLVLLISFKLFPAQVVIKPQVNLSDEELADAVVNMPLPDAMAKAAQDFDPSAPDASLVDLSNADAPPAYDAEDIIQLVDAVNVYPVIAAPIPVIAEVIAQLPVEVDPLVAERKALINDEKNNLLINYARAGKYKELLDLLSSPSVKIDFQNDSGESALFYACFEVGSKRVANDYNLVNSYNDIINLLLKFNANPNLANKAGITPFMWALSNHSSFLYLFFNAGADVHVIPPKNMFNNCERINKNKDENTALLAALRIGDLDWVEWLIGRNVDVNATNSTGLSPLHLACDLGRFQSVKLLIDRKANVNYNIPRLNLINSCFKWQNCSELIKLLLDKGVDPNIAFKESRESESYALFTAIWHHNTNVVKMLLEHKADVGVVKIVGSDRHSISDYAKWAKKSVKCAKNLEDQQERIKAAREIISLLKAARAGSKCVVM